MAWASLAPCSGLTALMGEFYYDWVETTTDPHSENGVKMARDALLTILAAGLAGAAQLSAQSLPAPQADYALTNVRIVAAPGRVIDRGTVLVRNGRIAAVGAQVTTPVNVVQMNLNGSSVYPGLIDAATSTGLPSTGRAPSGGAPAPAAEGGRGGGRGAAGGGARGGGGGGRAGTPAPLVLPELDAAAEAANMFAPSSDELAAFRAGGVTTVGLLFDGGIFPGRVGAALTGGYNESSLALRSAAGQQVAFGTRRGGYPSTGIGSVAFVRQSMLDAQHELALDKAFTAGRSAQRPSHDPLRRALMPMVGNESPAWFVASTERQLGRVSEIAREMGLRNWVVVGAQEGWRAIPSLKASGAPVVVSLDWPTLNSVTGRVFETTAPSSAVANDATANNNIRANAVALARAGIPVVLSSFGGESGATFRDRIRLTIEAGMSPDDALRAATVAPAALLGISGAVGTIDVGKLANLIVVAGNDLFASGAAIQHVFVEGRLYSMPAAAPARGGGPGGRGGGGARSDLKAETEPKSGNIERTK